MDREGFVENQAYEVLRRFIQLGLQWSTLHYNRFLVKTKGEKVEEAAKELEEKLGESPTGVGKPRFERALRVIELAVKRESEYSPDTESEMPPLKEAADLVRRSFEYCESQAGLLRDVFSVNQLMFGFAHEISNLVAQLDTHANTAERLLAELPKQQREEFGEFAGSLRRTRDRFDQQLRMFGIMTSKQSRLNRKSVALRKTTEEIIKCFDYILTYFEIRVKIDIPGDLRTGPMMESEILSIVVNLVTNSIKAVIAARGNNIMIEGRGSAEGTIIKVYDDGIGLSESLWEEVFQPMMSDPEGRLYNRLRDRIPDKAVYVLGVGTGFGLSIVRGIAQNYGGTAKFVKARSPWKTCVEVRLP
jgi:signal transduction histidine kinase